MLRQLSQRPESAPGLVCFCGDPIGVEPGSPDDLRLGCRDAVHYHCLTAYLQSKIGDRTAMKSEGITCPYGMECATPRLPGSPGLHGAYLISLDDLEILVDYKTPERSAALDALLQENSTTPLTHDEVSELRAWLVERDMHEGLCSWLKNESITFDEMNELVKLGEKSCVDFAALVRSRDTEVLTAALAAELVAHLSALRAGYTTQMDPYVLATTKPCPTCTVRSTHYHGHHCHHISPTTDGCPNCHVGFCYRCLSTEHDNRAKRGEASSCSCGSWSNFCSKIETPEEVKDHVKFAQGCIPYDERCGCIICPQCRQDSPCPECDGSCSVCRGFLNPGPMGLNEVWVARRLSRRIVTTAHHHRLTRAPNFASCKVCDGGGSSGLSESGGCGEVGQRGETETSAANHLLPSGGFLWSCRECEFDLCTMCAAATDKVAVPDKVRTSCHKHSLKKTLPPPVVSAATNGQRKFQCNWRGLGGGLCRGGEERGYSWSCTECDYHLCLSCLLISAGLSDFKTGSTPLITAIVGGASTSVITGILSKHSEQARVTDDDGTLPLVLALEHRASEQAVAAILAGTCCVFALLRSLIH